MKKFIYALLLLGLAAPVLAALISDTAVVPELRDTDRIPIGRAGNQVPYTTTPAQILTGYRNFSSHWGKRDSTKHDLVAFNLYSSYVAVTYATAASVGAHNTLGSSHSGHFTATNPHGTTAAVIGATPVTLFSQYTTQVRATYATQTALNQKSPILNNYSTVTKLGTGSSGEITAPYGFSSLFMNGTNGISIQNTVVYTGSRTAGTIFHNISSMYVCAKDNVCVRIGY